MFEHDLQLLCCPRTHESLRVVRVKRRDTDGELLDGELESVGGSQRYSVKNGIPRFVEATDYNSSWDYKWTCIDRGKGLNYLIADKNDPAYRIHDLFDRNGYGGKAHESARGGIALDIGCGIGQYSWRLMREYSPKKMVSLDLTGGVDIFRKLMLERFPEYKEHLLLVQASVFDMPFRDETFDYVFSLGVLMHTGNTRTAVRQAARVVRDGGELNIWVYGAIPVHLDIGETGRRVPYTLASFIPYQFYSIWVMAQIRLFRHLPHKVVVTLLRVFSSDLWYRICRIPILGYLPRVIFGTVMHPNRDYRFLNNYDGWCNRWADTWTEQELYPVLEEAEIVIRGISNWQTGIWGRKLKGFYE